MPHSCYKLTKYAKRQKRKTSHKVMAGVELDLDEDVFGNVSDAEIVKVQPGARKNNGLKRVLG
ncbi:hypothetical protein AAVH_07641 [Aphelenchoides avenae]|nr:hypothetical protein AAVH_07641 [Aphelenchus avenae]